MESPLSMASKKKLHLNRTEEPGLAKFLTRLVAFHWVTCLSLFNALVPLLSSRTRQEIFPTGFAMQRSLHKTSGRKVASRRSLVISNAYAYTPKFRQLGSSSLKVLTFFFSSGVPLGNS